MLTDFQVLGVNDPLGKAIELTLAGSQKDFPVVKDSRLVGLLNQTELLTAVAKNPEGTVGDAMHSDVPTASRHEMIEAILARMEQSDCPTLPVIASGDVVGMVTMDNIAEFLLIQAAARERQIQLA